MEGAALVAQVSTPEPYVYCDAGALRVAVLDYGCKRSILRRLAGAGAHVTVFPHTVDAEELLDYDAVLLSNGPGDPEPLAYEVQVVRELLGQRDLSFDEATRIIGAKIGKPDLAYVQFPYADYAAALQQAGVSKSVAGAYAEMEKAFDDGLVKSLEGRNAGNTTPTAFEEFAGVIAQAYHGAARAAGA